MKNIRIFLKPVGLFLAVFMVILSGPYQSATAALIGTESVINTDRAQNAREYLKSLLARQDVRNALVSQGIDPREAKNRIDSLTDEEATLVADQLQELPAGGSFFTTLLIVALIVFLVLLITDMTGYTDIFPFVKSNK
ncbi:MAG: PA2779 family protein [Desulfobacterales bacterium]|nr:PA2779 family protein [Desulfobacterales bacterium]